MPIFSKSANYIERGLSAGIAGEDRNAWVGQELLHDAQLEARGRPVKSCPAVGVRLIHVDSRSEQQRPHYVDALGLQPLVTDVVVHGCLSCVVSRAVPNLRFAAA